MTTLSLKLVVDKAKNRLVFAEADEDFVDILCSFLTLPLGTVIRLLGKQSMIGCMDNLYRSVENLDAKYLQTEACKKMLLEPRSESEVLCEGLKVNIYDLEHRRIYFSLTCECFTKTDNRLCSLISGVGCPCGNAMDKSIEWTKEVVARGCNKDGVFVKRGKRFVISDNLLVTPLLSMETTLSLFQKNGINDMDTVEVMTVVVTRNEILKLLGRLLVSATPLTDVLLLKLDTNEGHNAVANCHLLNMSTRIKSEENSTTAPPKLIRVKLLYDKVRKKVVSAQSGEDFVDILFSFLTLPLGRIVKLLDMNSTLGCLDYLYDSIEFSDYIKSEESKNLLLAPKLFQLEEKLSPDYRFRDSVIFSEVNPKLPSSSTECGGGYAKKSVVFMVSDEMEVTPLSAISGIEAIKGSKVTVDKLVEREVSLGEEEVLCLLKTCLLSHTPLSDVFSTTIKRRKIVQD